MYLFLLSRARDADGRFGLGSHLLPQVQSIPTRWDGVKNSGDAAFSESIHPTVFL